MEFIGWGLSGVGSSWMVVGVFASYIMVGRRFAIWMSVFSVAVVVAQILAIELGGYQFALDFSQYAYSHEAWFAQLLTVAIQTGSIVAVLTFIFRYLVERSKELSVHRSSLERTADILQSEIFEHDHTSRALAEALEHLQQIDQVKDAFVSNVSHELRTPIANLRLYMQLSQKRPDKAVEYIQTMNNEVQRLEKVVEQMLLMAKIQDGTDFGTWVHFDLQAIIKGAVEEFSNLISGRGLTIQFREISDMPHVFGSAGMIYQMIRSLLDNAIKYSPSGARIEIRSQVDVRDGLSLVGFTIVNTGVRIEQDEQRRIFERFYRGRSAIERNVPGAGLGLAAARQIAIIHHGTIRLQDTGSDQVSINVMIPSHAIVEAFVSE
jgi:signal transduction histidine kinase